LEDLKMGDQLKGQQINPTTGQCLVDEQIQRNKAWLEKKGVTPSSDYDQNARKSLSDPETVARLEKNAKEANARTESQGFKPVSNCVP
jgi:hypothetical protein